MSADNSLLPDNQDGEPEELSDYAKRHIHSCVGCPAPGAHFCSCGASKSDRQSGWSPAPASFQAGKPAWELYPDVAKRPVTPAASSPSSLGSPPELRALIADVRDALNVTVDAKGLTSLAAIEQYVSRLVEHMERLSGQAVGWRNIAKLNSPPPSGSPPAERIRGVTWLLIRDGAVLLERCPKKAAKLGVGEWFVPGGKIEGDETAMAALFREVREEWPTVVIEGGTELPVVQGSPIGLDVPGMFLMQPYAIVVRGEIPTHAANGVELRWTPLTEALASPVPQVRMMVAAAAAHTLKSVSGSPPELKKAENRIVIVEEDLFKRVKKILTPILRYPNERKQNNRVIREAIHTAVIAYREVPRISQSRGEK